VLHYSNNPDISHCFDWSLNKSTDTAGAATADAAAAAGSSQQLESLQWAAFYSDSEHEVLPVTDGYRITLTYNLRAVGHSNGSDVAPSSELAAAAAAEEEEEQEEDGDAAAVTESDSSKGELLTDLIKRMEKPKSEKPLPAAARAIPGDASWLTAADVASSAGLVAHIKELLADARWHPEST
jgi:hypothetical protein